MKCCSDPSSSSGPTSGPRPWPAPCPAPGLTPRTALASHPVASLRLQALALRATPARSLLQAPCPLRARKPGFTYKATHLTPCCLHTKGPGPQFAHCYHPEGRAGWVPASPPPRARRGMGYGGAPIMGTGEGREHVRGLGGSQGHSTSNRAQSSRPMLPPG